MNKQQYVNEQVILPLGTARVKVAALGIVEVLAHLENKVLAVHRADVAEMAKEFEGKERADYIIAERKQLPQGDDLTEQAIDFIGTLEGVQAIVIQAITKWNSLTPEEIVEIFEDGTEEEFTEIFNIASATLLADDDDGDEENKDDDTDDKSVKGKKRVKKKSTKKQKK